MGALSSLTISREGFSASHCSHLAPYIGCKSTCNPSSSLPKSSVLHLEVQGPNKEEIFWDSLTHWGPLGCTGMPGRGLLMLTRQH